MKKFVVSGIVTVSCWTEVDAETEEDAMAIASGRMLADVHIDGGYDVGECWHFEADGEPMITEVA